MVLSFITLILVFPITWLAALYSLEGFYILGEYWERKKEMKTTKQEERLYQFRCEEAKHGWNKKNFPMIQTSKEGY